MNHPVCHRRLEEGSRIVARSGSAQCHSRLGAKASGRQNHTTSPSANISTTGGGACLATQPQPMETPLAPLVRAPFDRSRPSRPATTHAHDALASTASPAQRIVTFARRPSGGPGWAKQNTIFENTKDGYFRAMDWTGQISLNGQTNFDFSRTRCSPLARARGDTKQRISPDGRITSLRPNAFRLRFPPPQTA